MPAPGDAEADRVPASVTRVMDCHVHVFPDRIFEAIRKWFDTHAWPIRYKLTAQEALDYLFSRGVDRIAALQYAHKPGIARELNSFMARLCQRNEKAIGMATVFPGERDARKILEEAFGLGLHGVKLHSHVQCFDMGSGAMNEIYEVCAEQGKPLIMHVGREPKSEAYACDPYDLCAAGKVETVLQNHPDLKLCVPHLGADEFSAYRGLLECFDHIWVDTTMMLAEYFPYTITSEFEGMRTDRIMYGTDFPNIPYAWDREIKRVMAFDLSADTQDRILFRNAVEFFSVPV
ncbi:MAG: amidohydrolase [Deltaproteobacteria bacterium]|nr:amidohydrolase [Deltaproteobacteria bacterium]